MESGDGIRDERRVGDFVWVVKRPVEDLPEEQGRARAEVEQHARLLHAAGSRIFTL